MNSHLFVWIIAGGWAAACVAAALFLIRCARRGYAGNTHEGVTLDSTVILHLPAEDGPAEKAPAGRHHEDTVVIVPSDYTPHIGRRLIARETQTQRIEWPQ